MKYCFRKARMGDAEAVYSIIADRVHWMDANGIRQWNTTDYLNVYPLAYYKENIDRLYVLAHNETGRVVCAAMLFETDTRWTPDVPALYIHNFVSDSAAPGAGRIFMREAELYADKLGKRCLRLDSAQDNTKLAAYYASLGFKACGTCRDGDYLGTLRQKPLTV